MYHISSLLSYWADSQKVLESCLDPLKEMAQIHIKQQKP